MVVVDRNLIEIAEPLMQDLRAAGMAVATFTAVEANPRTETVAQLTAALQKAACDVVVAIGGGSVMDAAKAAAMLAKNPGGVLDFIGCKHFAGGSLPTVMLPTTCGTGSEVTWVAVLTDEASQRKISIKGAQMFPSLALVDAELLASLPRNLLAWTGMDALTQIAARSCFVRPGLPMESICLMASSTIACVVALFRPCFDLLMHS